MALEEELHHASRHTVVGVCLKLGRRTAVEQRVGLQLGAEEVGDTVGSPVWSEEAAGECSAPSSAPATGCGAVSFGQSVGAMSVWKRSHLLETMVQCLSGPVEQGHVVAGDLVAGVCGPERRQMINAWNCLSRCQLKVEMGVQDPSHTSW